MGCAINVAPNPIDDPDGTTNDNSDNDEFLTLQDETGGACGAGAAAIVPLALLSLSALRLTTRRRR